MTFAAAQRVTASALNIFGSASSVQVTESTTESNISSTSYGAGAVNCETTFIAPPSGKVLVLLSANLGGTDPARLMISFEIRNNNVAGSVVTAAADNNGLMSDWSTGTTAAQAGGSPTLVDSLTPGNTYYIRAMRRVIGGSTSDYYMRRIVVTPLGA